MASQVANALSANTNVPPSSSLPQSSSSVPSDIATAPTQPSTSASGRPQRNAAKRHVAVSPDIARGGGAERAGARAEALPDAESRRPRQPSSQRGVLALLRPHRRPAPGPDPIPGVDAQHVDEAMAPLTDPASLPATVLVDVGTSSAQTVPHFVAEDPQSGSVASTPAVKWRQTASPMLCPLFQSLPASTWRWRRPVPMRKARPMLMREAEEDLDAEGEQEEDAESEPKDALPRSKSPPPPPPGANSGPPHGK